MGASNIEWTDATWNPVTGCTKVSPGCDHCFAARLASDRLKNHPRYKGLAAKGEWIAKPRCHEELLSEPLRWRKSRMVFVCDMSDWCHRLVPREFRFQMLDSCAASPSESIFQFLTKRPEEMATTFEQWYREAPHGGVTRWEMFGGPHPRFWLGVTAEDQQRADERYGVLAGILAAKRFVSLEPLLSETDCRRMWRNAVVPDWVIVGGETGPGARPMNSDWVRQIRDQCVEAGVPFLFKSWGDWWPCDGVSAGDCPVCHQVHGAMMPDGSALYPQLRVGKKCSGRLLDGRVWDQFPEPAKAAG